jgi:hypothetical protein
MNHDVHDTSPLSAGLRRREAPSAESDKTIPMCGRPNVTVAGEWRAGVAPAAQRLPARRPAGAEWIEPTEALVKGLTGMTDPSMILG